MSVTLTGSNGWFTRRGKEIGEINRIATACFGTPLDSAVAAMYQQYSDYEQNAVANLYAARDAVRASSQVYIANLQTQAIAGAIGQVDRDTPLLPATLDNALAKLIQQMKDTSQSLQRAVTTAAVTADAANEGDAVVHAHLTGPDGLPLDMVMPETLTATVSADEAGGATRYREPVVVVGAPTREFNDYRWPGGSGGTATFSLVDAADTTLNELANGDFLTWGGVGNNTPGSWTLLVGAAGTQVLRGSTSPVLRSADGTAYHMRFDSDGSTLTAIGQAPDLLPLTVYCLNLWARIDSADGSGTVVFKLIDGSGTTVQDDAGTSLTYTRDLNTQIGTSWTNVKVFWATPRVVADNTRLSIGFGVSPGAARVVDFALVSLAAATRLYPGGPFAAGFSKESRSARNDRYSLAVTNNLSRWSLTRALDGLYAVRAKGLAFPTASSPTISDSLIS